MVKPHPTAYYERAAAAVMSQLVPVKHCAISRSRGQMSWSLAKRFRVFLSDRHSMM